MAKHLKLRPALCASNLTYNPVRFLKKSIMACPLFRPAPRITTCSVVPPLGKRLNLSRVRGETVVVPSAVYQGSLRAARGAWKAEDHPDLAEGSAKWVHELRQESVKRFETIEQHRNTSNT